MHQHIKLFALALFLSYTSGMVAQEHTPSSFASADTLQLPKWEPHISVLTGFMGTNYGDNRLYTSVAPSLTYRSNDKWQLHAGFRITSDMGLSTLPADPTPKSMAPYRHRNGGTDLASAHFSAEYRVNENMWLMATVYHIGGSYAPLYSPMPGQVFDVSATALSAAAAFRFGNDNLLRLTFTYVRDHAGTLPWLCHDVWMHSGMGYYGFGPSYGFLSEPYCGEYWW